MSFQYVGMASWEENLCNDIFIFYLEVCCKMFQIGVYFCVEDTHELKVSDSYSAGTPLANITSAENGILKEDTGLIFKWAFDCSQAWRRCLPCLWGSYCYCTLHSYPLWASLLLFLFTHKMHFKLLISVLEVQHSSSSYQAPPLRDYHSSRLKTFLTAVGIVECWNQTLVNLYFKLYVVLIERGINIRRIEDEKTYSGLNLKCTS